MGRKGSCENQHVVKSGTWSAEEDKILMNYVQVHGEGKWRELSKRAGLKRSGKSSRLRWLNYLKPDIKRGNISSDEEDLIIRLHSLLGNRWSLIAGRLPGRTDNEIKNYWNTHLRKKKEKHNHNKTPRKSRVESKGSTKNSLDINSTTKSSLPTKVMVPNHATNDSANTMTDVIVTSCWDSHDPFASTPQDGHENCSESFPKQLDTCDKLTIPYEDCHCSNGCASVEIPEEDIGDEACWLDDSMGQAWRQSWELIDFFPSDEVAKFFSLSSM